MTPNTSRDDVHRRQDLLDATGDLFLRSPTTRRRRMLAAVAGLIMVTGLLVHFTLVSAAGNFVADALYAVMLFVVLSFVFVRASGWRIALAAFLICLAIELFQLTGVPSSLAEVFPPVRLLLGTTFAAIDLVAYFVGSVAAGLVGTWRPTG
jgi:uncharacterized membrane protein YdbT with pleckstrin-like domain